MRPAETEVRLEHFCGSSEGRRSRACGLLPAEAPALRAARARVGRGRRCCRTSAAPFLRPLHELLWLATQCTVILFTTTSTKFACLVSAPCCSPPPRPRRLRRRDCTRLGSRRCVGARSSSSSTPPRGLGRSTTARRCARNTFCGAGVRGNARLPHESRPSQMEATHVPFSPVRLRRPDLAAHSAFTSSRRLLCEVGEGDVLYPSCAPHRALGRQGWPRAYWRLGTAYCASALSSPWTVIPNCRAQVLVARGHGRAHQRCRLAE